MTVHELVCVADHSSRTCVKSSSSDTALYNGEGVMYTIEPSGTCIHWDMIVLAFINCERKHYGLNPLARIQAGSPKAG